MIEEPDSELEEFWEFASSDEGDYYHFYDDDGDVMLMGARFDYKCHAMDALMEAIADGSIPEEQMGSLVVQIMNSEIPYEWVPPKGVLVTYY